MSVQINSVFRAIACSMMLALALGACSSAKPLGGQRIAQPAEISEAPYKLTEFNLDWVDEPVIRLQYNYMGRTPDGKAPKALTDQVAKEAGEVIKILNTKGRPGLSEALIKAGAVQGKGTRIKVTPFHFYRSISGSGSGMLVLVQIFDANNELVWKTQLDVFSGWQWFGPETAPPTEAYARDFVDGLMLTMREAGWFGPHKSVKKSEQTRPVSVGDYRNHY